MVSAGSHCGRVIPPGGTIGVLGSGQLGRMFALAARSLGYRIHIYSPECAPPAGPVSDREWVGEYTDLTLIRRFAAAVDVVTFEFENVPAIATAAAVEIVPVRPSGEVLHVTQHRLREKMFLRDHGIPTTPFEPVTSLDELRRAVESIGLPAVLKTASFGYDGKGQVRIDSKDSLPEIWARFEGQAAVLEGFVRFSRELSVIAARTGAGEFAAYPVFENAHARHILDVSIAPARIDAAVSERAVDMARRILESFDVVGLMTVELFLTDGGELLVNELAPRTHNSGHLTIDACVTSQFEQQVRAVCGLPLGATDLQAPAAAMANLLGDLWDEGTPSWLMALEDPALKLHLYGKAEARAGRKMGHLTLAGPDADAVLKGVSRARDRLTPGSGGDPMA